MKNFGPNFFKIWLPLHALAVIALWWVADYWVWALMFWLVFGVIGNGVAAHRYFAHGQFSVSHQVRWLLGMLSTLGGIGKITHWEIQHKLHHLMVDTPGDPHSPHHGSAWHTIYGWTFSHGLDNKEYMQHRFAKKLAIKHARDPFYLFFDRYHYTIIYAFCAALALFDPVLVLMYALAYSIDFARLGLVNWFCHRGGYRNFDSNDRSTNNLLLGWLGMGFGWHNNHHAHPGQMILTHRWWEIDVEGYIAWLLSLTGKKRNDNHAC